MEKFSAYRDLGTGIQPFLRPIPPSGSETLTSLVLPFGYVVGAIRTALILALALLYLLSVHGVCFVLKIVPPLHRVVTHSFTAIIARSALLVLGLPWIPVEVVTRRRGRCTKLTEGWNPTAGDLIVSNWASTIEILWLAFRFNPVFVLPVYSPAAAAAPQSSTPLASPITRMPGRRTGTGSAAISSPATRAPTARIPILGFREVSILTMLSATGHVTTASQPGTPWIDSLQHIRSRADRPVVVFPECTTSNGRGLLRFAELFDAVDVPVKKFKVFIMCARFDPPTALCPSMTHPIPSTVLNPLPHIFSLTTSLAPFSMSIRLLSPTDSPSSSTFLASDFITGEKTDGILTEACAALIAQMGKMKRVGLGWEDKRAFLEFYEGKTR